MDDLSDLSDLSDLFKTNPRRLAELLDPTAGAADLCEAGDLADVHLHQLSAPLAAELSAHDPDIAARLRAWREAAGEPLETFGDVLRARRPPLALLEAIKEHAKISQARPGSGLPVEVATVLYMTSIALALDRYGERITALDDDALEAGLRWTSSLSWLDPSTRELVERALALLPGPGGSSSSRP